MVFLLLTSNILHTLFWYFYCEHVIAGWVCINKFIRETCIITLHSEKNPVSRMTMHFLRICATNLDFETNGHHHSETQLLEIVWTTKYNKLNQRPN